MCILLPRKYFQLPTSEVLSAEGHWEGFALGGWTWQEMSAHLAWDWNKAFCMPAVQDPLAIIGLLAIFLPFLILGVAIGTGVIDVNAGKP